VESATVLQRLVVVLAVPTLFLALPARSAAHVSATAARDFFTVTPCRLVDTRLAPGPLGGPALAANTSRVFVVVASPGLTVNTSYVHDERPVRAE
jgi:hypothetical protein